MSVNHRCSTMPLCPPILVLHFAHIIIMLCNSSSRTKFYKWNFPPISQQCFPHYSSSLQNRKKNKPTSKNPSTTTATNRNRHNGLIHCLFFFIFYSLSLIDVKLKTTIYGLYGKSRTGAVPVVLSSLFLFFVVRNWPSRGASTVWTWRNLPGFV